MSVERDYFRGDADEQNKRRQWKKLLSWRLGYRGDVRTSWRLPL